MSNAEVKGAAKCWFCGATPAEPWSSQGFGEDTPRKMPMCRRHGDGVRESLRLRSTGDDDAADTADAANGIETRPQFNHWMPPNAKVSGVPPHGTEQER